ncbi:hypothetical protein AAIR98_001040 [Elusimicrobium simillimum]|uniref:hypothetical protein n=1 Tax=Elusimicrobium simillimum TaxID=3143438 RepID=UPI003C6F8632
MKKIIALSVAVFCAVTGVAQNISKLENRLDSLQNVEKNIKKEIDSETSRILDNVSATTFIPIVIDANKVKDFGEQLDIYINKYPKIQEAKASLASTQANIGQTQLIKDFAKMSSHEFDAKYMSSDPNYFINPPSLTNAALIMVEEALKNSTYQAAGEKFHFSKVMTYAFYTYYLKEFFHMKGSFTPDRYQDFNLNISNRLSIARSKAVDTEEVILAYNELSNIMSRGHLNTLTKNLGVNDMDKVYKATFVYQKLFTNHKGSRAWENREHFQAAVINGIINLLNTNTLSGSLRCTTSAADVVIESYVLDDVYDRFFDAAQHMDFSKMDKDQKDRLIKAVVAKEKSGSKYVKKLKKLLQENNIVS